MLAREARCDALHVLYVEDDPVLAEMYTYLLGVAGFQVSLAADGQAGLKAAFDLDPDLVLLDIALPKLDGLAVLEQLRRRFYRGEVWILSNYSAAAMRRQADEDGASRWLIKSRTTPGQLRQLIDEWARTPIAKAADGGPPLRDLRGRPVEGLDEAVLIADDDGSYVAASDRALALLGYERQELMGAHIWDIAPDWEVPVAHSSFDAFKEHGHQAGEFVLRAKSGALITFDYDAYAQIRSGLHMSVLTPRVNSEVP